MLADDFIPLVMRGDTEAALSALGQDADLARLRSAQGVSVVCLAVYARQVKLAAALAAGRHDLDVFEAACLGDLARVVQLLTAEPDLVNAHSPDGFSPLGYSAFFGHAPLLQALILRGAEVDAPSSNAMRVCPLHSAAAHADPAKAVELASLLLDAGADPNAQQQGGFTALHEAALRGKLGLIEVLLEHAADPTIQNDAGASPLDLARSRGHQDAIQRLTPAE
jgi:uncharacterized protein